MLTAESLLRGRFKVQKLSQNKQIILAATTTINMMMMSVSWLVSWFVGCFAVSSWVGSFSGL
jgi:hypothetical protein